MKNGFVQVYLRSAVAILAVTALGKAIPAQTHYWCIEKPILGSFQYQFHLSNQSVLGTASAIEAGILLLILVSRRRWLPCLASGMWGGICLFVRLMFLGPDTSNSCGCLGWFQQVLPFPPEVLSTILLTLAAWLALGGIAALGFTWTTMKPREKDGVLAAGLVLAMCAAAFIRYFPPQPFVYGE